MDKQSLDIVNMQGIIDEGKRVFEKQIDSLNYIKETIDETFYECVKMIVNCNGRVIITGLGKSGHVSRKIAATMASLDIPAYFIHPAEALHGDLGRILENDIVLALSNSGETEEILKMLPSIKKIGAKMVSVTGNGKSSLAKLSDLSITLKIIKEASLYNLAPTSSTTAQMVFGDALAVVISNLKEFIPEKFALYHPSGSLGKRLLLKVEDIMIQENYSVTENTKLIDTVIYMSSNSLNGVVVVNENSKIRGIFTDGDLRRLLKQNNNLNKIFNEPILTFMNNSPTYIKGNCLAVEALELMKTGKKSPVIFLPVVNEEGISSGVVRIQDILKEGIF